MVEPSRRRIRNSRATRRNANRAQRRVSDVRRQRAVAEIPEEQGLQEVVPDPSLNMIRWYDSLNTPPDRLRMDDPVVLDDLVHLYSTPSTQLTVRARTLASLHLPNFQRLLMSAMAEVAMGRQSPLVAQLATINLLNELRTFSAFSMKGARITDAEAFKVADEHFEALEILQQSGQSLEILYPKDIQSNVFGEVLTGDAFFRKMDTFRSSRWRVSTARFILGEIVVGTVLCDKSDQTIRFGMAWEEQEGHFVIHSLNRIDFVYGEIVIPEDRKDPFSELGEQRRLQRRQERKAEVQL